MNNQAMSKITKWDGYSTMETFMVIVFLSEHPQYENHVRQIALKYEHHPVGPAGSIETYVRAKGGLVGLESWLVDWEEIAETFLLDYEA